MQPYRNDLDSLEARHAALENEVADKVRQRDEAARMLEDARAQQRAASYARPRRPRRTLVVVLGATALLLGLGALVREVKGNDEERAMKTAATLLERFADEMCACADRACATTVMERVSKWSSPGFSNGDPSPEMKKRFQRASKRIHACMTNALADANVERQ